MGNVSHVVPTIHPMLGLDCTPAGLPNEPIVTRDRKPRPHANPDAGDGD